MSDADGGAGERLVVALVRSVHGLKGDVRIEVLTDRPAERFVPGATLFREGDPVALTVTRAEPVANGPGWWLRFSEVPDRTAAERLRGAYLEAEVAAGTRPDDGVWWHEVIGATVADRHGVELGRVVDIYRAGGAEVYVVKGPGGVLDVPAVASVVLEWRPMDGRIVVDADALGLGAEDSS